MEEKKRYKATNVDVSGPFDGWIIEELDDDEYEKEAAKEAEVKKAAPNNTKLTREELEKKREEQLNKIRDLINKKKKEKEEAGKTQTSTQVQAQTQSVPTNNQVQTNTQTSSFTSTANLSDEELEKVLVQKSKDTGIPIEVLRMIEEKKKEIRAKKKNGEGGNVDPKKFDSPTGIEIADTVEARRKQKEADEYYEEREVRKQPPKKKAPNGEEIGDRKGLEAQVESHDLYNVMDDVGLDDEGLDNDGLDN